MYAGKNVQLRQYVESRDGNRKNYKNVEASASTLTGNMLERIERLSAVSLFSNKQFGEGPSTVVAADDSDKTKVIKRALSAMEELKTFIHLAEPLRKEGYALAIPLGLGPKPFGYKTEVSTETCNVGINPVSIVGMLMDVNQWTDVFSSIVSRAFLLEVIWSGVGGTYSGKLQVMKAEFQVPSPLVPGRDTYFARFCKQHNEGAWAVVDITLGSSVPYCRRASGCWIQEMPQGCSKVTWLEHSEVDNRNVHVIYKPLVDACLAYGAKRWVYTLQRQCDRLLHNTVLRGTNARKRLVKMAERIFMVFCGGVRGSLTHPWTIITGKGTADDIRVTRKRVNEGTVLINAAASFSIPLEPRRIFDFLSDHTRHHQWDDFSSAGNVKVICQVANGSDLGNRVSLIRVNSNMLILQETRTDPMASYVVYALVDNLFMRTLISGGDLDNVSLLPKGFAILPDGREDHVGGNGGSIITIGLQNLIDSSPVASLGLGPVNTISNHVRNTIEHIMASWLLDNI